MTVGEKRPDSMERRSELTAGRLRWAGLAGDSDGEWSSSGGESSSTVR